MDNLLAAAKRPRILITSSKITDLSRKISVGGDDMLLNAINHMNIKSGAYIFQDQSFSRDFGQLVILSPTEDQEQPKFYFRGAITQVDTDTVDDNLKGDLDFTNAPHPVTIRGGALQKISPNIRRGVSVVSVDLHLVSYPDKTVLAGGSVANSMVVTNKGFGTGGSGLIKLTGYNLTLSFNRVESIGQAVRNLIELGTIELLGRHAKVPYWQCLNIEPTNEKLENLKRSAYITTPKTISVLKTQRMLTKLGLYANQPDGRMNLATHAALAKFQAGKDLIATGDLNYDVYARLQQELKGYPVNGRRRGGVPRKKLISQRPVGKHLAIAAMRSRYELSDEFVVKLKSNASGYLYCFYQSGAGEVIQILPKEPNVRLEVSKGFSRSLPNKNDSFALKFEDKSNMQSVMCILQDNRAGAVSPFDNKFKMFKSLPVARLEDIPANFSGLKDTIVISKTISP
ncbi:MAG: DUF4384 domain-containing protein [Amylibacter sp.]|nr:DUF4384 domain-containing protein [Amylibacter sp.]